MFSTYAGCGLCHGEALVLVKPAASHCVSGGRKEAALSFLGLEVSICTVKCFHQVMT